MSNTSQVSAAQFHRAAELQSKIESLQAELAKALGGTASPSKAAKVGTALAPTAARKKGTLSAAGRAKLVALAKARWAKIKRSGKKRF